MPPSLRRSRDVLVVEARPLPVVHRGPRDVSGTPGSHDSDDIVTDLSGCLPLMFGSGCIEALHRAWLRLGGGRPTRQTTAQPPPRGCCRRGAVARSQARDCCRGCGIDRWGLEHAGDGMAGTGRMGLLEQRCRHRPSCARDVLCFFFHKKRCISRRAGGRVPCAPEPRAPSTPLLYSVVSFPHSPKWK